MRRRRNSDEEIQALRRRLAQEPGDKKAMSSLVVALLRASDHRGLVALGVDAVPILRERDAGNDSLARRARIDLVRLELSILGNGVAFTASPLGSDIPLSLWRSSGPTFGHTEDGVEVVSAFREGGGFEKLIPLADVAHIGAGARRAFDESAGGWRITSLGFDGETVGGEMVRAWIFGSAPNGARTWNGWARPYMTLSQARKFVRQWRRSAGETQDEGLVFEIREDPDGFVVVHRDTNETDEPVVIQPEWIEGLNAPQEPVYEMSCGLVWSEVT